MLSHCSHISLCPCNRVFVLRLEGLTIPDLFLMSACTKLSHQHFVLTKFELAEWVKIALVVSIWWLWHVWSLKGGLQSASLYCQFIAFTAVKGCVWGYEPRWSVLEGKVLGQSRYGSRRPKQGIQEWIKGLCLKAASWQKSKFRHTLGTCVYREVSVRTDSWHGSSNVR